MDGMEWNDIDETLQGCLGPETEIEFVTGQNPIMPSPILPSFSTILMYFQWDGPNTAVSTPTDRLWWINTSHDIHQRTLGVCN